MNTARISVPGPSGPIEFECFDNPLSRWTALSILHGETYPILPFVSRVRTIVDAGANVGSASALFAAHYPEARIHAVEPGAAPFALLQRNVGGLPNVLTYNIALGDEDRAAKLRSGALDSVTASIAPAGEGTAGEPVTMRDAGSWLKEAGVDRIDVLKVDVEGSELNVLRSMRSWLPAVQLIYLEYGGLETRQEIERLTESSHEIAIGRVMLTHGELILIHRDLVGREAEVAIATIVQEQIRSRSTLSAQ